MQIAAIYMASGQGKRFGSNKLLYSLGGRPLYQHGFIHLQQALQHLQAENGWGCSLIVVSVYEEILSWCRSQGTVAVYNDQAAEGIAASTRLGVKQAGFADRYAFFVADQPLLQTATIEGFLRSFMASGYKLGCVHDGSRQGNPGIFDISFREELLQLHGEQGGRTILRSHSDAIWYGRVRPEELLDMDRPEDAAIIGTYF